jgi:CheY-like chemotaxis protein
MQGVRDTVGAPSERPPTVLVVEDEPLVRASIAKYLRDCGMVVLEAADADQALPQLAAQRVDAVFSDVQLPGSQNGVELVRAIREQYPQTKVLLTTAYSPFPAMAGVVLLKKPYFLFDVERQLRSMLRLAGPKPIPRSSK